MYTVTTTTTTTTTTPTPYTTTITGTTRLGTERRGGASASSLSGHVFVLAVFGVCIVQFLKLWRARALCLIFIPMGNTLSYDLRMEKILIIWNDWKKTFLFPFLNFAGKFIINMNKKYIEQFVFENNLLTRSFSVQILKMNLYKWTIFKRVLLMIYLTAKWFECIEKSVEMCVIFFKSYQ